MYNLKSKPLTLKKNAKKFEKAIKREKYEKGEIHDGDGLRYVIGPMLLASGNLEATLKSFNWYSEEFDDDIGEPYQYICWTLALYRSGDHEAAKHKLIETMFQNLYLFPCLLGEEQASIDMWYSSNQAEESYLEFAPEGIFDLWEEEEITWAKEVYHEEKVAKLREKFIHLYHSLKGEPQGEKRSQLVDEVFDLEENYLNYLGKL